MKFSWKKVYYRSIIFLLNNVITNFFLILFKKDSLIKKWRGNWEHYVYDEKKTLQENVGYSHIPGIQAAVDKSHVLFKEFIEKNVPANSRVLDIGCGTGLYLKDLPGGHVLYGIDLNSAFLDKAASVVPGAILIKGNYLNEVIDTRFDFIFSFGVFMYFERSRLDFFLDKINEQLSPGGIFYLQYSHAVHLKDLFYPDLSYIKHSPYFLEKKAAKKFDVIEHHHFYDDRKVKYYDDKHYFFPDGTNTRVDTVLNTYLLVLRKRNK